MNIALCFESVLPRRGGCETYIAGLARRLVAEGHEVHLYAWQWDADALPAGLHCHRVSLPTWPRFLRPWSFTLACRRLLALADHDVSVGFDKVAGVDVLYPQGGVYAASVDCNLLKHPRPLLRRLLRASKWFDLAHLSFLLLERAQYRGDALLVAISRMVRAHMEGCYAVPPDRLRVLPIATLPERFEEVDRPRRRHEARQRWGLPPGRVAALFAGMNYRLKGIEPLLRALARLGSAPLDIVVAGSPATGPWARQARRLGVADRVRFVGYCADMREAYFASDLLVHPTFYDPCANVVLEALACGLPVITTRHNGAGELMRPLPTGGGASAEGYVLDDPHDDGRLAWALEQLLDPDRRTACAAAARHNAAGWTFEHHYRGLLAILAEAAQRKRRAA